MEIKRVPIDSLTPDPGNVRRHGPRNLAAIRASLERFGQQRPLVVDADGVVRAGNGTLEAARALGWTEVAIVRSDLDGIDLEAYAIADNRSAELAAWSEDLGSSLERLMAGGVDLDAVGFSDDEMRRLIGGATAEVETPEAPKDPITQRGDMWLLGEHRLLCGDSTSAEDVARLLGGAMPGLMVTDPPYGVNYDPAWRNRAAAEGHLAYSARRVGQVPNDDRADWSDAWRLFPGDVICSWHPAGAPSLVHAAALQDSGFILRMQIIWAKSNFPIGRGDYHVRHEPCWYAVRKGAKARRTDDRTQTTLWEINLDANVSGGHSTQKPLECMARPMRNHDIREVYDPFLGSGTSLIAAEQLGRRCFAMEIDPGYCDVAVARWESQSGNKAQRA